MSIFLLSDSTNIGNKITNILLTLVNYIIQFTRIIAERGDKDKKTVQIQMKIF